MFDAFHFREDSAQRKRLAEHIGHHMRVLIAEHIAAKVPASRFDEVHRKHPYQDTGKSFIPVIYQRAIGDAEAGARASKVKAAMAGSLGSGVLGSQGRREPGQHAVPICPPGDDRPTDEADGLHGGEPVGI